MAAGAVELAKPVAVTHCCVPFDSLGLGSLIGIVVRGLPSPRPSPRGEGEHHFVKPATGQFSSFIPRVSPLEASTSLISLSDLRPRLGVLSSSFSVRWTRSPLY